jgi:hypothetical protein
MRDKQASDFTLPVKPFVDLLFAENYLAVIEPRFHPDRLPADTIAEVIRFYPGQLTLPYLAFF